MSDDYNSNADFDSLFNLNSNTDSGSGGLTAADVERIASNTFVRGYQALQAGVAQVQQMTIDAVSEVEKKHPGFMERYRDPEICRKFIEQRPAVARAILAAESGQGTQSLPELYEVFDESARSYAEQPSRGSKPTPSGSASVLSLAQINKLPPEQRREHVEALGNRVADMSIDAADPSNEVFKIERGE